MRKYQLETLLKKAVVLEAEQQGERLNKHPDTAPIPKEAQERFDTALYGTPKQKRAHRIRTVMGRILAYGLTGIAATAAVVLLFFFVGRGTKDMQVTPVAPVGTDAPPAPGNPADTAIAPPTAWGHTPSPTAASERKTITEAELIGTWKLQGGMMYENGIRAELELKKDGTASIDVSYWNKTDRTESDAFTVQDNTICFWRGGQQDPIVTSDSGTWFQYDPERDAILLRLDNSAMTVLMMFLRAEVSDDYQFLYGFWVPKQETNPPAYIEFLADGTARYPIGDSNSASEPDVVLPYKIDATDPNVILFPTSDAIEKAVYVPETNELEVYYNDESTGDVTYVKSGRAASAPTASANNAGGASAEQWTDNGIDGIGVVRGNTNGNLHSNHGRALCDGNNIYYIDQESDPVRICKYNLSTKETQVLVEFKDETSPMNIGYLNLIGTDLYYAEGIYTGQTQSIYRISTIDLRSEKIYETTDLLFHLFAAYDRLFITDMQGILICDLNGKEINRIDGYYLSGMMDGILYAYRSDADGCYAMDLNGTVKDFYDTVVSPIPINGYLVDLDNLAGEPLAYKGIMTVVNAATHESRSFEVPEISCAFFWNISKDAIYLQKYGEDETGEIYRMDWYGNGLTMVDDRIFYTGVSLWEDRLLADMVPCDPYLDVLCASWENPDREIIRYVREATNELFAYDLDFDGNRETVVYQVDEDLSHILRIGKNTVTLHFVEMDYRISKAFLVRPDGFNSDFVLVLNVHSTWLDDGYVVILFLQGTTVQSTKYLHENGGAFISDGKLYLYAENSILGTFSGSRAYVGWNLEPESEWYETEIPDWIEEHQVTREQQIQMGVLLHVIRDLPCTIGEKPSTLEAGTYLYLLRWRDTNDLAEVMTEDGRIARLAFTPIHPDLDGQYIIGYAIDGVKAEDYFDNISRAG